MVFKTIDIFKYLPNKYYNEYLETYQVNTANNF